MLSFPNKIVVGVTGGIACGKSTICKKFGGLGWEVISTDSLVHQLLLQDQDVINQITDRWGGGVSEHGIIDKVRLARVVFESPTDRNWLENLLHPIVREKWMSHIRLSSKNKFVVEIPLLFENNLDALFTKTISVHASDSMQFIRLKERGLSDAQVTSRINSQMSIGEKSERADFVILGNGDHQFINSQIQLFLTILLSAVPESN
jgi:dephospho-CoA kinase